MKFLPKYHDRNLKTIAELADKTQERVMKFYRYAVEKGVDLLIYEGMRTVEEQKALVARGASQTMKSYHLVGQAIDFVPVKNGVAVWNGYDTPEMKDVLAYAQKECSLVWGGSWKSFIDKPHLQYDVCGYGKDTFKNKPVPFEVPKPVVKPAPKPVAKPAPAIKPVGRIKIVNLKNFTYIYEKPSDKSKQVGTAKLNSTLLISGSVPDYFEVIHNGKRAYVKAKYAKRV